MTYPRTTVWTHLLLYRNPYRAVWPRQRTLQLRFTAHPYAVRAISYTAVRRIRYGVQPYAIATCVRNTEASLTAHNQGNTTIILKKSEPPSGEVFLGLLSFQIQVNNNVRSYTSQEIWLELPTHIQYLYFIKGCWLCSTSPLDPMHFGWPLNCCQAVRWLFKNQQNHWKLFFHVKQGR